MPGYAYEQVKHLSKGDVTMITLALIQDYLIIPGTVAHDIPSKGAFLRGPRLWSKGEPTEDRFVYILNADAYSFKGYDFRRTCDYIIYGNSYPNIEGASYLYVPSHGLTVEQLFNDVQAVFEHIELNYRYRLVYSALTERSPEKLLDIAYPFFGNPMYLADSAFTLLARTEDVHVENPTLQWVSMSEQGALDPGIVLKINPKDISKLDELDHASFMYTVDTGTGRNIVAHIEKNESRVANIAIIECDTIMKDYHLALADHLVECIGYTLEGNRELQKRTGVLYERWLEMLLEGKIHTVNEISRHLENLRWDEPGVYQIAVIDFFDKRNNSENSLSWHWDALSSLLPGRKCFIYHNAIVILAHSRLNDARLEDSLKDCKSFLIMHKLRCAISEPYQDVLTTSSHYEQADRIRRFATEDEPIVIHANRLVDDLISSSLRSRSWLTNIRAEIAELHHEDVNNSSDLVRTLYMYLLHDRSLKNAAAALYVHRNTLVYRIDKIQSRYGFDLDDPEERLSLIMSCRIALDRRDKQAEG